MLGNLPPVSRSKLSSINLLCITKSQTLVRYGPNVILEPVMRDIKELEQVIIIITFYNIYKPILSNLIEWISSNYSKFSNQFLWITVFSTRG